MPLKRARRLVKSAKRSRSMSVDGDSFNATPNRFTNPNSVITPGLNNPDQAIISNSNATEDAPPTNMNVVANVRTNNNYVASDMLGITMTVTQEADEISETSNAKNDEVSESYWGLVVKKARTSRDSMRVTRGFTAINSPINANSSDAVSVDANASIVNYYHVKPAKTGNSTSKITSSVANNDSAVEGDESTDTPTLPSKWHENPRLYRLLYKSLVFLARQRNIAIDVNAVIELCCPDPDSSEFTVLEDDDDPVDGSKNATAITDANVAVTHEIAYSMLTLPVDVLPEAEEDWFWSVQQCRIVFAAFVHVLEKRHDFVIKAEQLRRLHLLMNVKKHGIRNEIAALRYTGIYLNTWLKEGRKRLPANLGNNGLHACHSAQAICGWSA